jgi:DNA polymerase elongation subunit (family B)
MKRYCAWDIETCPTALSLMRTYEASGRKPPGNYKKPEAISQWVADDREDWETQRIKEYSLSARTGRICALSMYTQKEGALDLTALREEDEAPLIRDALSVLGGCGVKDGRVDVLVGFNSRQFDWPFLMLRMCYHRIDPLEFNPDRRFWQDCHARYSKNNVDVRDIVTFGDYRASGTLSDWSAWAGQGEKDTAGSQVWQWVQDGDADALATHCRSDARRTAALFERVYTLYAGY